MTSDTPPKSKRKNYAHILEHIRELIHSTLDFDELMKIIIKETSAAIDCESAVISLRKGTNWVANYVYGIPDDTIGLCLSDEDLPLAVLAVQTGKIIVINDTFNDDRVNSEHLKKWGIRSVIILPLLTQNEVIGVIFFNYYKVIHHFHKPLIEFTSNIASSITLALKNTLLYNAVRSELAELKKLEEKLENTYHLNTAILESISDGFFFLDNKWRFKYVNQQAANTIGIEPKDLLDQNIWELFPTLKGSLKEIYYQKVVLERTAVQFEFPGFLTRNYCYCSVYPTSEGFLVYWIDITERKKQQELLLKAERENNEALRKTIEMKDEFLSLISHEFKTPLTVINSAVQAMKQICRNELSDKANGYLNKILQNSNRQLKLVNNLLDITRINAGQLKVCKCDADIVHMTKSITESIAVFAEQKGIRLSYSSTLKRKVIGIDEVKYERILLNLLSNAVKFTPKGKSVSVKVSQKVVDRKYMVCIKVKDDGVGIPEDKRELIFERFGQVDSSLSRQAEGTGIGLHLVRMFVEMLDGKILLESRVGKGSIFTILLPSKKVNDTPIEHMIKEISDNRLIQATSIEFSDVYL